MKAIVVSTGTYLRGKIFIGDYSKDSGPDGVFPANKLSECFKKLGIRFSEFKNTKEFQYLYEYYNLLSYIQCKMSNRRCWYFLINVFFSNHGNYMIKINISWIG